MSMSVYTVAMPDLIFLFAKEKWQRADTVHRPFLLLSPYKLILYVYQDEKKIK